jgi:GAF domain-containing protein
MPLPDNEAKRVAVLRGYEILDSAPEKAFDDLAKLAAIVCDVPGAMITFIDSERQWFKSNTGFVANEIPREMSFCAHAIMLQDVMVVEDAQKDERFAGNPLVTSGPQIRFYAGSPLIAPTGEALGTVCVIDHRPRTVSENQKTALKLLSNQVQVLLEWRRYMNRAKGSTVGG